MLTTASQCTISHLWPATPGAATAFGILLAAGLSQGATFFDAYQAAVTAAAQENAALVSHLFSLTNDDEVRSLIAGLHDDMRNILLSGSTIFLQ